MRTKLVKRFYCDHCSKAKMRAEAMLRHEAVCLRNPDRSCYLCCEDDLEKRPKPMPLLLAALAANGLDGLRNECDDCPACTLAAILQNKDLLDDDYLDFDYKAEKERWYSERHDGSGY